MTSLIRSLDSRDDSYHIDNFFIVWSRWQLDKWRLLVINEALMHTFSHHKQCCNLTFIHSRKIDHHVLHFLIGFIGEPALHLNAAAKSGLFMAGITTR